MGCCYTSAEIDAKIAKYKSLADKYETAIDTVATTGQSYQFDDGNQRVLVTRGNLSQQRATLEYLEGRVAYWCGQRDGVARNIVPGY